MLVDSALGIRLVSKALSIWQKNEKEESVVNDLNVLIACIKKMLGNSTDYTLNVLYRAKEACDKNGLKTFSIKLALKIEKAEVLRESSKKCLAELQKLGLKIGSTVHCKKCPHLRCKTIVVELSPVNLKEGFVKVRCKDEIPGEPVTVSADKIKLVELSNN